MNAGVEQLLSGPGRHRIRGPNGQPRTSPSGEPSNLVVLALIASAVTCVGVALRAPDPVRLPLTLCCWLWLAGSALHYACTGEELHLRPSAVGAGIGLALLALTSQLATHLTWPSGRAGTAIMAAVSSLAITGRWIVTDVTTGQHNNGLNDTATTATAESSAKPGGDVLRAWHGAARKESQVRRLARGAFALHTLVVMLLGVSATTWIVGLLNARLANISGYGLLPALPPIWYAALFCALAATVIAGRAESKLFVVAIVIVVLILHATPAILYDVPRYTWTYKHLGVVDYIGTFQQLPRPKDIYFNWPGFFTAAHWLSDASSVTPTSLARWAPPFFQLANTAGVFYLARTFSRNQRTVALSTTIFVVTIWVGQDYFSPQALAYFLGIVLIGLIVRLLKPAGWGAEPSHGRHQWVLITMLWLAIVTTHQLTPVALWIITAGISLVLRSRGPRLLLWLGTLEALWLWLGWPYLRKTAYSLLSFDPLRGASESLPPSQSPLPGMQLRTAAVYVLFFGLFAAGVSYGILTVRDQRNRVLLVAAIGPALVLVIQNYGGEGQLRTYLFALPFLAILTAKLVYRVSTRSRSYIAAQYAAVLTLGVLFLPAYFGQEKFTRVVKSDIAAMEWFYANSPRGAEAIYLAPNAPSRMNSRYLLHPLQSDASPTVLSYKPFLDSPSAATLVSYLRTRSGPTYFVLTRSQVNYVEYFGLLSNSTVSELPAELDATRGVEAVYRSDEAFIWRVEPE